MSIVSQIVITDGAAADAFKEVCGWKPTKEELRKVLAKFDDENLDVHLMNEAYEFLCDYIREVMK